MLAVASEGACLAGYLQRCGHYVLGPLLACWVLLLADDGKINAPAEHFKTSILLFFYVLCISGRQSSGRSAEEGWNTSGRASSKSCPSTRSGSLNREPPG